MIKKKLLSLAAAALAACSVSATAFATDYTYDTFAKRLYTNSQVKLAYMTKEDASGNDAVVNVTSGLEGGDYYATFYIERYVTNAPATNEYDLWINGKHYLQYKNNQGIHGERYRLVCSMEPQANAVQLYIQGKWAP